MSSTTAGDAQQPLLKLSDLSLNPAPSFPALPVEILPKIIKLALDDDDFSRRCITKLACGQVAKLWRDASEIGLEYLVNSTKKAGRLVAWLEGSGRGNDVLRLEVQMGESQIGHNKFSLLVLECCFMKSLKLKVQQVDGSRHATAPFGQTLASSVMACRGLETFSVNSGDMIMCHGFFQRALAHKGKLQELEIVGRLLPNEMTYGEFEEQDVDYDFISALPSLRKLSLDQVSAAFVEMVISAASKSIVEITIKELDMDFSYGIPLEPLLTEVRGLEVLEFPDAAWTSSDDATGSEALDIIRNSISKLRSISIGFNCIIEGNIFADLVQAQSLLHLSLNCTEFTYADALIDFNVEPVVTYLEEAPSLRTFALPLQLVGISKSSKGLWSPKDIDLVKETAKSRNIELFFA